MSPGHFAQIQIAFAKIIDQVAVERGLPGRATLVALMTALQSPIRRTWTTAMPIPWVSSAAPGCRLGHGRQIMDPRYAADAFFGGPTPNPPGLVDINGWPSMSYNGRCTGCSGLGLPGCSTLRTSKRRGRSRRQQGSSHRARRSVRRPNGRTRVVKTTEGLVQDACESDGLIAGKPVNGVWPPAAATVTDPTGTGGWSRRGQRHGSLEPVNGLGSS